MRRSRAPVIVIVVVVVVVVVVAVVALASGCVGRAPSEPLPAPDLDAGRVDDAGITDAGVEDAGVADGGPEDGGIDSDAGTDAGPEDAGFTGAPCATGSDIATLGGAYLLVNLAEEQLCTRNAFVDLASPDDYVVGFRCGMHGPTVRPDGRIAFLQNDGDNVTAMRLFVGDVDELREDADPRATRADCRYPSQPLLNDDVLSFPGCEEAASFGGELIYVPGDVGQYAYTCSSFSTWFDESGASVGTDVVALDGARRVLRFDSGQLLIAAAAERGTSVLSIFGDLHAARGEESSFLVAVDDGSGNGTALHRIDGATTTTVLGRYADFGGFGPVPHLDENGALYVLESVNDVRVVVRYAPDESPGERIFPTETSPPFVKATHFIGGGW